MLHCTQCEESQKFRMILLFARELLDKLVVLGLEVLLVLTQTASMNF